KDLEITTLKILSAASGNKYSPSEILEKISFVMTDSASHNINVIEMVCEELDVESVPKTLLCNAHPLMLFQNKIIEVFKDIHAHLGAKRINKCFLVDVDFRHDDFISKSMKCLTNFITKDYSAKPWNRFSQ
ncbi:unnamed protein product, partial [Meganyctiphanes norvegica]